MAEDYSLKEQRGDIERYVSGRISKLQGMYLSPSTRGKAARNLAVLRRSASKSPGRDPDVWAVEFDGMPPSLQGHGEKPSIGEMATHIALTLYAVHQQSQEQGMHQKGSEYDIGSSVRKYAFLGRGAEGLEEGQLPRRFAAMSTADSIDELAHHARQLIHLLKANSIPIDYGRLARQLLEFQIPSMRDKVRLEWGRAYARAKAAITEKHAVEDSD